MNDDDALLDRKSAAARLGEMGFPISPSTLSTMATRGGGPAYRRFGARALYSESDLIAWARGRLTPPRRSTSERDAAKSAD